MIVVMPFGHTPDRPGGNMLANTDFGEDLIGDLIPYVDGNFRTEAGRKVGAMAGLLDGRLAYAALRPDAPRAVRLHRRVLDGPRPPGACRRDRLRNRQTTPRSKKAASDLDLVYYAMGKDDFLYGSVAPTRAMLDQVRHRSRLQRRPAAATPGSTGGAISPISRRGCSGSRLAPGEPRAARRQGLVEPAARGAARAAPSVRIAGAGALGDAPQRRR